MPSRLDPIWIVQCSNCNRTLAGSPLKLDERQYCEIIEQIRSKQNTAADCTRLFKVSPATVSRIMTRAEEAERQAKEARLS
jgi:hypothetical protein